MAFRKETEQEGIWNGTSEEALAVDHNERDFDKEAEAEDIVVKG